MLLLLEMKRLHVLLLLLMGHTTLLVARVDRLNRHPRREHHRRRPTLLPRTRRLLALLRRHVIRLHVLLLLLMGHTTLLVTRVDRLNRHPQREHRPLWRRASALQHRNPGGQGLTRRLPIVVASNRLLLHYGIWRQSTELVRAVWGLGDLDGDARLDRRWNLRPELCMLSWIGGRRRRHWGWHWGVIWCLIECCPPWESWHACFGFDLQFEVGHLTVIRDASNDKFCCAAHDKLGCRGHGAAGTVLRGIQRTLVARTDVMHRHVPCRVLCQQEDR